MAINAITPIRLGYFSKSPVLAVANALQLLKRYGFAVEATPVQSSAEQFRILAAGGYDLVLTSPDNVGAYRYSAANPIGEQLDVRIVLAVDGGVGLCLVVGPDITDVADLRGRTVAVDVPQSGFAYGLLALLASHGLRAGEDFELVSLGSTPRRATAIIDGKCDATVLNGGFPFAAERAGCRVLGRLRDVARPYLGTVLAGTGAWLDEHVNEGQRFCRLWLEAAAALLDPSMAAQIDPLLPEVFGVAAELVPAMRAVLADPDDGIVADGVVRPAALDVVFALRARFAEPEAVRGMELARAGADDIIDARFAGKRPATANG